MQAGLPHEEYRIIVIVKMVAFFYYKLLRLLQESLDVVDTLLVLGKGFYLHFVFNALLLEGCIEQVVIADQVLQIS